MNTSALASALGEVLYGGINPDIPGHGGRECVMYLDRRLMVLDTAIATLMMVVVGIFAMKTFTLPSHVSLDGNPVLKRTLLVFLCLVFGVELGYKICSLQVLYLLNPCHVITMVQIYLLAVNPSRVSYSVLRIMVHYLYGAFIAIVLPDTHARQFPGEVVVYWVQHTLVFFVVPPYLVYLWGLRALEPMREWAWSCFAGIVFGIHHLYIMQPIAMVTEVNLNYMMCPATKDPFNGPYYRLAAIFHQALCLLTLGKLYSLFLRLFGPHKKLK